MTNKIGKVKFGNFIFEGKVIKKCSQCNQEIQPEWEHAYNNEWCPACGCNREYVNFE